jgi:hypothetical protein
MKKLFGLLLLTAFALAAGELGGKWSGKFDITRSDGETKADSAYMDLKLDGTKVTGTAGLSRTANWRKASSLFKWIRRVADRLPSSWSLTAIPFAAAPRGQATEARRCPPKWI